MEHTAGLATSALGHLGGHLGSPEPLGKPLELAAPRREPLGAARDVLDIPLGVHETALGARPLPAVAAFPRFWSTGIPRSPGRIPARSTVSLIRQRFR